MGTRTEHAPGTFSWVDLTTNDGAAAKEFYGALFGWEFEDNEIPGNGGIYTMCKVEADNVAAISPSPDDIPPHWNSYVTRSSPTPRARRLRSSGRRRRLTLPTGPGGSLARIAPPCRYRLGD